MANEQFGGELGGPESLNAGEISFGGPTLQTTKSRVHFATDNIASILARPQQEDATLKYFDHLSGSTEGDLQLEAMEQRNTSGEPDDRDHAVQPNTGLSTSLKPHYQQGGSEATEKRVQHNLHHVQAEIQEISGDSIAEM